MHNTVKIFPTPQELAEVFALDLVNQIKMAEKRRSSFTIALSGGNTPRLLFSVLAENFSTLVDWNFVHFFWGDERCVPPDNSESNYGMAKKALLDKIRIPSSNIHRIQGEKDPEKEAVRYSKEIVIFTRERDGLPVFDLIILGLGEDGHTASIFPGDSKLLNSEKIYDVATHPVRIRKRITITGRVINNADNIVFLVTGANKAGIITSIINKSGSLNYPAAYIAPGKGTLKWYLDKEAAELLSDNY
jgi:6-phosphogluconolactonase